MAEVQVCAFHSDEGITPVYLNDETRGWRYTCLRTKGHPTEGTFSWVTVPEPPDLPGISGLARDLNLHIELPAALATFTGSWVEYGVLEQAYATANPKDFAVLVDRYGHTAIAARKYTASAYLARTLGDLSRVGSVLYHPGPATGRWSYNSEISWWALPPEPAWDASNSWEALDCTVSYVPGQTEL